MTAVNYRYPAIQGEYEAELENELEGEDEWESEDEWEAEDELEGEEFIGGLARIAGSLLGEEEAEWEDEYEVESEGEYETEDEYEFEFEAEAENESEGELEDELEAELEEEAEGFVNPIRRVYRDAEVMAHLAKQASASESEAEAEAFIGALIPLAARLIPRAATLMARNAPTIVRGATRIVRGLRRNPQTRRLVSAMPVILQRTAQSLADQASNGQNIDRRAIVRTLGTTTERVLRGPGRARAMRAVNVFDRRWHRRRRCDCAGAGIPATRTYPSARPRVPNPYTRPVGYQRPAPSRRMRSGYSRVNRRGRRR
jgi:hypothetical protein